MKRSTILAIVAVGVLNAAIVGFAIMRLLPKDASPIPIGRDTTFVVGPLDAEGRVDYLAALNERYARDVDPAENSLVAMWSVFGGKSMKPLPPDDYFQALKMSPPTADRSLFVEYHELVEELAKGDEAAADRLNKEFDRSLERLWTAAECPLPAEWLKRNEAAAAKLKEALRRTKFYRPLYRATGEGEDRTLLGAPVFELGLLRELGRLFACRALRRAAEGDVTAAFDDLLAGRRLGRLASQGPAMMDTMVGCTLDAITAEAERVILRSCRPGAPELKRYLAELQKLPPIADFAERIEYSERFTYLEMIQSLRTAGGRWARVDLTEASREGNRWFDRAVAACRLPKGVARLDELKRIRDDLAVLRRKYESRGGPDRDELDAIDDDELGEYCVMKFFPGVPYVYESFTGCEQRFELSKIAVAIMLFRGEQGRYPSTLDDLRPRYFDEIPGDRFSDAPLHYRLEGDGFLLYSVGPNRNDDGGESDRYEADSTQERDDLALGVGTK